MTTQSSRTYIEKAFPIQEISALAIKEGNSKRPVYHLHKWWARRLTSIVRGLLVGSTLSKDADEQEFWQKFYGKNSLDDYTVMDIFMGGGSSLVEAKKMGAKTIGVDIDPMACFITSKELQTVDFTQLEREYKKLENEVAQKIKGIYWTQVHGQKKPVINYFWVYQVECPECKNIFEAHPHYQVYHNKHQQGVVCKHCGELMSVSPQEDVFTCTKCKQTTEIKQGNTKRGFCTCPECSSKFPVRERVNATDNLKLFAVEYEENGQRRYKQADDNDRNLYSEAEKLFEKHCEDLHLPDALISVENIRDSRPLTHGYRYYKDLFNKRQLYALGLILKHISKISDLKMKEWLLLAFSDALASNNMLCSYAFGYQKLTPLFGIHAYTVPSRPVENNVWGTGGLGRGSFEKIFNKMIRSKQYCENPYETRMHNNATKKVFTSEKIRSNVTFDAKKFYDSESDALILNQSSTQLDQVKNKSVDLILTDPPYYDNLHYSHLADFYFQWIKNHINDNDTNPLINSLYAQEDTEDNYANFVGRLKKIFNEAQSKLKDDGMMVFSYHHNKENAWRAIGESLKENNFYISNIFPVRSEGQSAYHSDSQSIKWDSILIARKKAFLSDVSISDIDSLIKEWKQTIEKENYAMNDSDKLSFFRSLAVWCYVNGDENLHQLFSKIDITREL